MLAIVGLPFDVWTEQRTKKWRLSSEGLSRIENFANVDMPAPLTLPDVRLSTDRHATKYYMLLAAQLAGKHGASFH